MKKTKEKTLADKLFPEEYSGETPSDSVLSIPPEQRRLHTETYDFSISTIIEQLTSKHIFIPEFQRGFIWDTGRKSRLIESLIIQCPIPVIYLNQEKDERLSVIDGNQRLNSILHYVKLNDFELQGLTAYPELEGYKFVDLDPRFQRHIMNRTLRCITIMKDTHPQVKFDVFERLNSGSVKLKPQELRHGIYHGSLIKLITRLGKDSNWRELVYLATDKRMKGDELILRFLAFHYNSDNYAKPLNSFLNEFNQEKRNITSQEEEEITEVFTKTIANVKGLFGDYAFKIFDKKLKILSKFNAALFDAEMLAVSKQMERNSTMWPSKPSISFIKKIGGLFEKEEFLKSITRATSDEQSVKYRISEVHKVLKSNY